MSLLVTNTTAAILELNDLGIGLEPGAILDLALESDGVIVANSATDGDLFDLVTDGDLIVSDPLTGATLSVPEALLSLQNHNESHYRMPVGGRLADAVDVDTAAAATNDVLSFDGTKWISTSLPETHNAYEIVDADGDTYVNVDNANSVDLDRIDFITGGFQSARISKGTLTLRDDGTPGATPEIIFTNTDPAGNSASIRQKDNGLELSATASATSQLELLSGSDMGVLFAGYDNTRDDTGITPQTNVLYTDTSGKMLSAPLVAPTGMFDSDGDTSVTVEQTVNGDEDMVEVTVAGNQAAVFDRFGLTLLSDDNPANEPRLLFSNTDGVANSASIRHISGALQLTATGAPQNQLELYDGPTMDIRLGGYANTRSDAPAPAGALYTTSDGLLQYGPLNRVQLTGDTMTGDLIMDGPSTDIILTNSAGITALGSGGVIQTDVGTASAPSLAVADDNTGIYSPGNNRLGLSAGGNDKIIISGAGAPDVSMFGEIRLDNYPSTRSDGPTAKALYVDAQGDIKYGDVSTPTNIIDADGDTSITVERTADDDTIRFTVRGEEVISITDGQLFINDNDTPGSSPKILFGNTDTGGNFATVGHSDGALFISPAGSGAPAILAKDANEVEIIPELQLTAYPNTRLDGVTSTALATDFFGNVVRSAVSSIRTLDNITNASAGPTAVSFTVANELVGFFTNQGLTLTGEDLPDQAPRLTFTNTSNTGDNAHIYYDGGELVLTSSNSVTSNQLRLMGDTTTEDMLFGGYPNTRDDTASVPQRNMLYTDERGRIQSAPEPLAPVYPIWGEENGNISVSANNYEYSFGNGSVGANEGADVSGIPIGVRSRLVAIGVSAKNATGGTGMVRISVTNNGTTVSTSDEASGTGFNTKVQTVTDVSADNAIFEIGDTLQFLTATATGTFGDVRVVAWLERIR